MATLYDKQKTRFYIFINEDGGRSGILLSTLKESCIKIKNAIKSAKVLNPYKDII